MIETVPVRDAATVIVLRTGPTGREVLMGRRGAGAAFMPGKRVFPGGAMEAADAAVELAEPLAEPCARRLADGVGDELARALVVAAIRELWEETGLVLGRRGRWASPPPGWEGFAATGFRPAAGAARFVFRAVTPPGRPRRFDARFFLVPAEALAPGGENFARADGELADLGWLPLAEARRQDLPFVTELALAEAARIDPLVAAPPPPCILNEESGTRAFRLEP